MPNKLKKIQVREISLVDEPASPGADIILTKRRGGAVLKALGISFEEFQKEAAEAGKTVQLVDDEDDEAEEDGTEDGEDDVSEMTEKSLREAEAFRRMRAASVRKYVRRVILKAERDLSDGKSGGISHSESDRPGREDTRSNATKGSNEVAVFNQAKAHPPAASERFDEWLPRVFGNQADTLDAAELRCAREVFSTLRQGSVLKARADGALMTIAKSMHARDPSKTVYQHWAVAAKQHPELYSAMRKSAPNTDFGRFDASGGASAGFDMIDNGWGGGDEGEGTALDQLNKHATDIRKSSMSTPKPLSQAQAFVRACQAHPQIYAAHRRGE